MAEQKIEVKAGEFKSLRVGACFPSKTNPRAKWNGGSTEDLVESVKARGVLQPIVVRPKSPGYEVVAGHRRLEAAIKAGLLEIPAHVLHLTDLEALEIQVIENLQRADLHPLDEAEGFAALMKSGKYTASGLAVRLGKSAAYVYARLKLCDLPADAKKAFTDGRLLPGIAILIARIPVSRLREEAWRTLGRGDWSVAMAQKWVREHAMLELGEAPFNPADKDLVPTAGACSGCPKRTGNAAELFPDVKAKDLCTDALCYNSKADVAWKIRAERHEKAGGKVLDAAGSKEVFKFGGDHVDSASGYLALGEKAYTDEKSRTWRAIVGKACPPVTLARTAERRVVEIVRKDEMAKALKSIGLGRLLGERKASAEDSARMRKAKALRAAAKTALVEIQEKASKARLDSNFLKNLLLCGDHEGRTEAQIERMTEGDLKAALVGNASRDAVNGANSTWSDGTGPIKAICKAFGVRWEPYLLQAKADAEPKRKAGMVVPPNVIICKAKDAPAAAALLKSMKKAAKAKRA